MEVIILLRDTQEDYGSGGSEIVGVYYDHESVEKKIAQDYPEAKKEYKNSWKLPSFSFMQEGLHTETWKVL